MSEQTFPYGGQAVIEGVLMRGQRQATVAVREPTGGIALQHFALANKQRHIWAKLPILRGMLLIWDMLKLGMQALNFSASVAFGEDAEASKGETKGAMALSIGFGISFFLLLPSFLANLTAYLGASVLLREVLESLLRLGFLIGYIVAISQLPEVQRLFAYHGAEHKAVNAYEAGANLTVEGIRDFSLFHPRCGTSFLGIVIVIGFGVFLFLGELPLWAKLLSRVFLFPLIAALAYECLRLVTTQYHRPWVRLFLAPSIALQQLTTRQPNDEMLTVALAALRPVLLADGVENQVFCPKQEWGFRTGA